MHAECRGEDGPVNTVTTALLWDIDDLHYCYAETVDNEIRVGVCPEEPGIVVN